jgi:hypothetical protein
MYVLVTEGKPVTAVTPATAVTQASAVTPTTAMIPAEAGTSEAVGCQKQLMIFVTIHEKIFTMATT